MRAVRFSHLLFVLVAMASLLTGTSRGGSAPAFRLIVNPANPTTSVERRFVGEAFLKKATRWPDGSLVRPVDQASDSPVRQRFCDEVLGRSVAAVKSFWQQAVFAGRDLPPPELDSDDDVIKYVLRYPGAFGYVSASANVERVKILTIR